MDKFTKIVLRLTESKTKYVEDVVQSWLVGCLGLWRINLCRLFNAKFCLYVYTLKQGFLNEYLVGKIFYGQDFFCLHMINQF